MCRDFPSPPAEAAAAAPCGFDSDESVVVELVSPLLLLEPELEPLSFSAVVVEAVAVRGLADLWRGGRARDMRELARWSQMNETK